MVGAIAAYLLMSGLADRHEPQLSQIKLGRLFVACYIGGYFGARFLSILIDEPQVSGVVATIAALFRLGPMTFYGGAIGATVAGLAYCRLAALPAANILDVSMPAGLLGLAAGRIGCFLNGDDYGKPVSLVDGAAPWWAVTFPNLQDDVARYPVQLMATVGATLIVASLCWRFATLRNRFFAGAVGLVAVASYATFRFGLEFFRGDPRGTVGMLSTSQFISLVVLVACVCAFGYFAWRSTVFRNDRN